MDARRAVDAAVARRGSRGSARSATASRERAIARRARRPLVVARAADAEQPAAHGDRGAGLLRRDEPVDASPGLGLRCEEGRGSFEQIALLLQARVLAPQPRAAPRARRWSGRRRARGDRAWSWRRQLRSVCSDTPRLSASSRGVRPARSICTASRRNSSGYAGRVLGTMDTILSRLSGASRSGVRKTGGIQVQRVDCCIRVKAASTASAPRRVRWATGTSAGDPPRIRLLSPWGKQVSASSASGARAVVHFDVDGGFRVRPPAPAVAALRQRLGGLAPSRVPAGLPGCVGMYPHVRQLDTRRRPYPSADRKLCRLVRPATSSPS